LKTGLGFVQGHWKWQHLIGCSGAPIPIERWHTSDGR